MLVFPIIIALAINPKVITHELVKSDKGREALMKVLTSTFDEQQRQKIIFDRLFEWEKDYAIRSRDQTKRLLAIAAMPAGEERRLAAIAFQPEIDRMSKEAEEMKSALEKLGIKPKGKE